MVWEAQLEGIPYTSARLASQNWELDNITPAVEYLRASRQKSESKKRVPHEVVKHRKKTERERVSERNCDRHFVGSLSDDADAARQKQVSDDSAQVAASSAVR